MITAYDIFIQHYLNNATLYLGPAGNCPEWRKTAEREAATCFPSMKGK